MQTFGHHEGVEVVGLVFDVVEVVFEALFADEVIDEVDGILGVLHQQIVFDEQKPVGLRSRNRPPSVRTRQSRSYGHDAGAPRRGYRRLPLRGLKDPSGVCRGRCSGGKSATDRDPGGVADATDDPRLWEKLLQHWETCGPEAVRIDDDRPRRFHRAVIGLKDAGEDRAFLGFVEKDGEFILVPIAPKMAWKMCPIGLDIAAWTRGFWRRMAASRVDPERGRPEMK